MSDVNMVILAGNLTRDPELREVGSGDRKNSVCGFRIASNGRREKTTFIEVEMWGRNGETVQKHFKKGSKIIVKGELELDTWEDKTSGERKSKYKLSCHDFYFGGPKQKDGGGEAGQDDDLLGL